MTQSLLFKKEKPKIKITSQEPRAEKKENKYIENYFTKEKLKDKKVIIVIEYNYTSDWKTDILERKPEEHLDGWYEGDYNGFLGGCGSEGWEKEGENLTLEQKKERMIKWLKEGLLEDGYNKKNISIKEIPLNKEHLEDWKKRFKVDVERDKEFINKDFDKKKEELTKEIKIKNFNVDEYLKNI